MKIFCLFIVFVLFMRSVDSCEGALVGHWKFDESVNPSGNTVAVDSGANALNGIYQPLSGPGPVLGEEGARSWTGTSAKFNGVKDEIILFRPVLLNNLVSNFTVMAWINPDNLSGIKRVFARNPSEGWGFGMNGSRLRFTTWGRRDFDTGFVMLSNQWQHVCLTFEYDTVASNHMAKFYVNAALVASITDSRPASSGTTKNWFIGSTGSAEYFKGGIDDVRIYDSVLSLAEVGAAAFGSGNPFRDRTAQALFEYRFPESFDGSSTAVTDLSRAKNNAVMDYARGYSSTMRPDGMTGGSITGSNGGHGGTEAIDLLNTSGVALNGGFKMQMWHYWPGNYSDNRKIIDYAGTDGVKTFGGQVVFTVSGNTVAADIDEDRWYFIEAFFDTEGYSAEQDGGYAGEFKVRGNMYLYLDGELAASQWNATKSSYGDRLNRKIGINKHPNGGEYNQGFLYDPAVYLGVGYVVPPPSGTVILIQ